ncbi:MAG: hypothetical protein KKE17_04420 [Proteobacteria bacterium]|nr:hypothetical protein [Pseudomonadota bacterium]MBU1709231.1 hypothetical protein [Pseudomonadota bacterium]
MHNSQSGTMVVPTSVDSGNPQAALLNNNCTGCHTGVNAAADVGSTIPYVLTTSGVEYGSTGTEILSNTLAGGNFYWLTESAAKGHNVKTISNTNNKVPPGGSVSMNLTCAGSSGCHGDPAISNEAYSIRYAHHSDTSLSIDGSTIARSYRYLDGIVGIEDSDYEFRPDASNHNQYKGYRRTTDDTSTNTETTMSYLCSRCHVNFHSGAGDLGFSDDAAPFESPWLRHPTDFDLADASGSEYDSYNKVSGTAKAYSVISPVASTSVASVLPAVLSTAGDAIIMCLTCHRAHGTPNDAILRWDYKAWPGAAGYNGCEVCHTSKN